MQGAGDQLLARAAGAADQHRGVGGRHLLDQLHDPLHGRAGADQAVARRLVGELLHPLPLAPGQLHLLVGLLDVDFQLGQVEGLGQVVVGAPLHGLDGRLDAAVGGQHERLQLRLALLELCQQLDAAHARQVQVEQGDVDTRLGRLGQRLLAAAGRGHSHALPLEAARQGLP